MSVALQHIDDIPAYIFGKESQMSYRGYSAMLDHAEGVEGFALWFSCAAFGLLVLYFCWFNFWGMRGANHTVSFKFLGFHRGDYSAKMEYITPSFQRYCLSAIAMGLLSIWLYGVAFGGVGAAGGSSYNESIAIYILVAVASVALYQYLIVTLIGVVAASPETTKVIYLIKGITMSILTMIATPTIICYALAHGSAQQFFLYIIVFTLVAVASVYVFETFLLFMAKKVSVLHTILYLCAVEVFPVTLLWGFFYR